MNFLKFGKAALCRLIGYGLVLGLGALAVHVYLTNPLYVEKLPYFAKAMWKRFDVDCSQSAPAGLDSILKNVSLPYFSLNGQLVYRDKEGSVSVCHTGGESRDRVYRLASTTKLITAFAVVELEGRGGIDLDAKVVSFFPELEGEVVEDRFVREMTVGQLLNHSSGLGGPFGSDNMIKKGERPWCPYDINALTRIRLAGRPGTNHVYSNVAYCLAGEIISRVTGTSYRDYIRTRYLSDYRTLEFVDGPYLPSEPDYDFSNDYRFGRSYVGWLDFGALSSAAGLRGDPEEFAALVQQLVKQNPGILTEGGIDDCKGKGLKDCYSYPFLIRQGKYGEEIGVQGGYLPGVSTLVAATSDGAVVVWAAAGAPMESKHRELVTNKIVSFLSQQNEKNSLQ